MMRYRTVDDDESEGMKQECFGDAMNDPNIWEEELDQFWFHLVGSNTSVFNGYYDKFVAYGLDDIQVVLFDTNFDDEASDEIEAND